jgi:geranylgeranyl diphosphate synthase type I
VTLRERFGSRALGDAGAILVGDLACGYAQDALLASDRAPAAVLRAARVFARIQTDVVQGQLAEMCVASAGRERGLGPPSETIHALKTASYTVTGPLLLGAALAGGGGAEAAELERFGRPLGVAFQLRDDVLGMFGDSAATGKPVGSDLRQGKQTSLVAALREGGGAEAEALLARTLGNEGAAPDDVAAVVRAMASSGAKAKVEARIGALSAEARAALPRTAPASTWLAGAIAALAERAA